MDLLDQKVIGYEATKNTLRQILDILRRRSIYEVRGAVIPPWITDGVGTRSREKPDGRCFHGGIRETLYRIS